MPIRPIVVALFVFVCAFARADDATRPSVAELVRSLKQSDPSGRAKAAAEFGGLEDIDADAKAALRKALADESRTVLGRAAVALWRLDRPPLKDVLPALLAARNDADEEIRKAAEEAWAEIGPGVRAAMPFVRKSLAASDNQAMQKAVAALSQPGLDAVPAILDAVLEASPAGTAYPGPNGESITVGPAAVPPQFHGACVQALTRIGAPAVPTLTEALHDSSSVTRAAAATALGRMGPAAKPALSALIGLFNDRDPLVRSRAAEAVGHVGQAVPEAVIALTAALAHKDTNVRRAVVTALPRRPMAPAVAIALAQALEDPEPFVRVQAAMALSAGDPPVPAAVVTLAEELRGRDALLRVQAGQTLEKLAGKARPAVPTLMALAGDRDYNARVIAGRVLARLGGAEADRGRGALRELLAHEVFDIRIGAAEALWDVGAVKEAAPVLLAALGSNDPNGTIRFRVQQRLRPKAGQAKDMVPVLADALADGNVAVRNQVLELLRQYGQSAKPAAPAVARLLGSSDQQVRQSALSTLHAIGGPPKEAIPDLVEALKVPDPSLRSQIVDLFSQLGQAAKEAAPALRKLVADGSGAERVQALRVLFRITQGDQKDLLSVLGELIRSGDQNVRTQARNLLYELNPSAVTGLLPVLLDALKSDDRDLRTYAASALFRLPSDLPPDARAVLTDLLKTAPPETRLWIARFLYQRGDKPAAVAALTDLLRTENVDLRIQAAESLWPHRPDRQSAALPVLREALKSANVDTRLRVARLLLPAAPEAECKAAAAVINAILRDGPSPLRAQALATLNRIEADAVRDVAEGLRAALTDQQPQTRLQAARLLAQAGVDERRIAIDSLADLAGDSQQYISSQAQAALLGLGRDGEAAIVRGLIATLKDPARRAGALSNIPRISTAAATPAIPLLKDLLTEPEVQTRLRAAELLARFATEPETKSAAAAALSEILKSSPTGYHATAAAALQMLGPDYARNVRRAHRDLLKDPSTSVRLMAAQNLIQTGNAADRKAVADVLEELQTAEQPLERIRAAGLLAEAAPERAGDAVATLLDVSNDPQWRMAALSAVARIGPPHAVEILPKLREFLKDPSRGDRGVWATLIGQLGPAAAEAVPDVAAALESPGAAHAAAYALVRMGPNGVAAVVKAMNSDQILTRHMAMQALATVQPAVLDAVPRMIDLAAGSNVGDRNTARAALDKIGTGAVPALAKLLNAPELHRRRLAAEMLAGVESYSKPAVPALEKAIGNTDPMVRRSAARAALHGGSRSRLVVGTLVELLKSDDLTARQEVAKTLGTAWPLPDDLVAALKIALYDADEPLRLHAARALVRLDATAAEAGAVIAAAIQPTAPSQQALNALCQVGVRPAALRAAVPAVREALKHLRTPVDSYLISRVAFALARADGPAAVGPLAQLIEEPRVHNYVSALAQALGECGPDGVAALRKLLNHRDPLLRSVALDQLGYDARRDATLIPEIVARLKDSDAQVRTRALLALRAAGPNARPAADVTAQCLNDPAPTVRKAAAYATAYIGGASGRDVALDQVRSVLAELAGPTGDVEAAAPEALDSLGRFGADAAAAVPQVLSLLNLPDVISRAKAVEALGRIGRPAADKVVPVLTDLLKANDAIVRAHAAVALWRITGNAEPVVPVLAASLGEPGVRWTIVQWTMKVRVVGQIPGARNPTQPPPGTPVQYYLAFWSPFPRASGPDESVCRLVVHTLAEIGPRAKAAVPALQSLRDDVEEDVRQAASAAIKKIEGSK